MQSRQILFLSAEEVRQVLPMAEAIACMKEAFVALSRREVELPPRGHIAVPQHQGNALFMPAYWPGPDQLGVKAITLFDGNHARGLPRIQSVMLLFDGTTGSPTAVMDGTSLTAIRTGAASGAATDLLARRDAEVVAIFGAGVHGRTQLEAVCCVRWIEMAWVFDPRRDDAVAFAHEMTERLEIPVRVASSPAEALADADVVCTATTSRTPVFADRDLKPGVHINAIGSYLADVQEIPAETVLRSWIVVDHRESALAESGDLIVPLRQGLLPPDAVKMELGEVAAGEQPGRASDDQLTLFKSVGVGIQDLTAAHAALSRAKQLGLGTALTL